MGKISRWTRTKEFRAFREHNSTPSSWARGFSLVSWTRAAQSCSAMLYRCSKNACGHVYLNSLSFENRKRNVRHSSLDISITILLLQEQSGNGFHSSFLVWRCSWSGFWLHWVCQLLYVQVCCGLNVYSQNLPRIFSKDERKALHSEFVLVFCSEAHILNTQSIL